MRTRILLTLLGIIAFNSNQLFAIDRVVQQNGPAGTYASISAAITASVDGDNIVINNKTDGLPWIENITINKSLTLVSAVDNIQWWMEGNVSITMAEGRTVTIVGLRNTSTSGNVVKTGSTPVNRTVVNILSSDLAGDITMGSGVNLYLGSSKADDVSFTFGKIIGNDLKSITCNPDAVTTEDINQIIGNRVGVWINSVYTAFYYNNNTQYLFCSNNYVYAYNYYACSISALKSGSVANRIINSVFASTGSGNVSMYVSHSSGQLSLENNILCRGYSYPSGYSNGVYITTSALPLTTCTYNMFYNNSTSSSTVLSASLNNFSDINADASNFSTNGALNVGTAHIDAGNLSNASLDLDLTRNDIGAFGGSYSMANFLPLMNNTESSRVNYMSTPRIVNQGGTVNVQAIGFDK